MKKGKLFMLCACLVILFAVALIVVILLPSGGKKVVLSDIVVGATDEKTARSNSEIIKKAITGAGANTVLVLPDGVIAVEGPFSILLKKGLTIKGGNTELLNVSYSPHVHSGEKAGLFKVTRSKNIKFESFKIDFLYHTTADGVITEVKNGRTYFEIYPEFISGDKMPIIGGETVYSVLSANDECFLDERWPNGSFTLKKEGDGIFSVDTEIGKRGLRICCRIAYGSGCMPTFFVSDTRGLSLEGVGCYSCPSAFFYATYGNSDFDFRNVTVKVRDGSKALLASNEDSIHTKHTSGYIRVSDSEFYGLGDDALNAHTKLCVINGVIDNSVTCTVGNDGSAPPFGFFGKGDTVEFYEKSLESLGTATVKSCFGEKLTLDSVPDGVRSGCTVQSLTYSPSVTYTNNKVGFGRARGILLQSRNATVTGCTFEDLRLSAVLAAPDFNYWYEAGFVDNLEITGNSFIRCTNPVKDAGFGVITVNTSHDNPTSVKKSLHKSVTVTGNSFEGCLGSFLRTSGVGELITDIE